jgi:hypothetical protein
MCGLHKYGSRFVLLVCWEFEAGLWSLPVTGVRNDVGGAGGRTVGCGGVLYVVRGGGCGG